MVKAIPEGYHSVTPIFIFKNARTAIDFYKAAFGAEERYAMPTPDGKGIMHAEMIIGNSIIMASDENPQQQCRSAESVGESPVSFYLYVSDVDAAFATAVAAGATALLQVQQMFWGDRVGLLQDPFGYRWMLATHLKDPTPQELEEGAKAACSERAS